MQDIGMSAKPHCFKIGQECPHEIEGDPKLVFLLMPFAPEFDEVYQQFRNPFSLALPARACVRENGFLEADE